MLYSPAASQASEVQLCDGKGREGPRLFAVLKTRDSGVQFGAFSTVQPPTYSAKWPQFKFQSSLEHSWVYTGSAQAGLSWLYLTQILLSLMSYHIERLLADQRL